VFKINGRRTLEFTDSEDKSYLLEIKNRLGDILTQATISKEDVKRVALGPALCKVILADMYSSDKYLESIEKYNV